MEDTIRNLLKAEEILRSSNQQYEHLREKKESAVASTATEEPTSAEEPTHLETLLHTLQNFDSKGSKKTKDDDLNIIVSRNNHQ